MYNLKKKKKNPQILRYHHLILLQIILAYNEHYDSSCHTKVISNLINSTSTHV